MILKKKKLIKHDINVSFSSFQDKERRNALLARSELESCLSPRSHRNFFKLFSTGLGERRGRKCARQFLRTALLTGSPFLQDIGSKFVGLPGLAGGPDLGFSFP